jgi:hypothetical protein
MWDEKWEPKRSDRPERRSFPIFSLTLVTSTAAERQELGRLRTGGFWLSEGESGHREL